MLPLNGRMRVPSPAANTNALFGIIAPDPAAARFAPSYIAGGHIGGIPIGEHAERRMRQGALQVVPYAGHVTQVLRLAVATVEAGKDAEDFGRALRRQGRIKLGEAGGVEFRIVLEAGADVAAEQRYLQRFRHIDPRVLE